MQHIIREAHLSDHHSINEISKHLGYNELTLHEATEQLKYLIHSRLDTVYVAEVDKQIVGWIHAFEAHKLATASFTEIAGLVVHPDFRRQRIGHHLVNHVINHHQRIVRVRCNEKRTTAHVFL